MVRSATFVLTLLALAGCAAGTHVDRRQVADELVQRVGFCPGPAAPDCSAVIPPGVDLSDGVSEDEAIALALANNADYQTRLTDLVLAWADVIEAGQLANPTVTTLFPLGPKQWEFALTFPLQVLIQRPQRVAAAELESRRVAAQLVQDGLNVVRDVRVAYADLVLALDQAANAQASLGRRTEIARRANVRQKAGDVSPLDVATANLYRLEGQPNVARAAQEIELAGQRLRFVLGLGGVDGPPLQPRPLPSYPALHVSQSPAELIARALSTRAELLAARDAVASAQQRAELAHYDYLSVSAVLPDINSRGRKGFEAGPGLEATVPLFNQNQGAVGRTAGQWEQARRQHEALRQQAAWEVASSYQRLVQAGEQLPIVAGQIEPQAVQAFEAALAAYLEDGTSLLYLLELSRQSDAAQVRRATLSAELRRAAAELERSVGGRVFGAQPAMPIPAEARP